MRTIATVFHKEMLDTLRDRRTVMFMIVIPLLLFPILFKVMFSISKSHMEKERAKQLTVALIDNGNAQRFAEILNAQEELVVDLSVEKDSLRAFVSSGRLDGAFVVADDFDEEVADLDAGRIEFYYKSTDDAKIVRNRLTALVEEYEEEILEQRFERLELDEDVVEGIELRRYNVATAKEQFGTQVGGFLPYIFILFCFMGAMYPAIDLGAGEKERGTMETLLTAPVNRFHILVGKFGVIVLAGIASASISMFGMFLGLKSSGELPPELLELIGKILGWDTVMLVFSLLLPLTIFFAGLLLSISLSAKSFKEAQSMISPLNIAIIVPAAIGMLPGIKMSVATALIPVLNVSLATREIIAGTMTPGHMVLVYASLIVLALASLYGSAQWFRRESTLFRT